MMLNNSTTTYLGSSAQLQKDERIRQLATALTNRVLAPNHPMVTRFVYLCVMVYGDRPTRHYYLHRSVNKIFSC